MGLLAIIVSFATAGPAGAQTSGGIVEIPLITKIKTEPGVRTVLATMAVPGDLVGQVCSVESRAENNSSVHPGNDLVITSGSASATLSDIESSPGAVTTAAGTMTLGDEVTVTLVMGPDGVFSAGATAVVVLECSPPPTTTTTAAPTTTVPPSTSSAATTTTTVAAPTTTIAGPTTSIAGPSSTSVPVTTTVPPVTPELAFTGPGEVIVLAIVGVVLLDLGYLTFSAQFPGRGRSRRS